MMLNAARGCQVIAMWLLTGMSQKSHTPMDIISFNFLYWSSLHKAGVFKHGGAHGGPWKRLGNKH